MPKLNRSSKSKQKLSEALSSLLKEHELNEITVIDLVEKAQINRSTFYLHYKSLDEFLDDLESQHYRHLQEKMDQFFSNASWLGYINRPHHAQNLPILEFILEEISLNIQLQAFIDARKYNSEFLIKLIDSGYQKAAESLEKTNPEVDKGRFKYYYSFISLGFVGIIFTWIENDLKESAEEISRLCHQMIYKNVEILLD